MNVDYLSFEQIVRDPGHALSPDKADDLNTGGQSYETAFNNVSLIIEAVGDTPIDQVVNIQKNKQPRAVERVLSRALEAAASGKSVRVTVERDALTPPDVLIRKLT